MKNVTPIILASITLALCGCSTADGPLLARDTDTDENGNAVTTEDQANSMNRNYVQGSGGNSNQTNGLGAGGMSGNNSSVGMH